MGRVAEYKLYWNRIKKIVEVTCSGGQEYPITNKVLCCD